MSFCKKGERNCGKSQGLRFGSRRRLTVDGSDSKRRVAIRTRWKELPAVGLRLVPNGICDKENIARVRLKEERAASYQVAIRKVRLDDDVEVKAEDR